MILFSIGSILHLNYRNVIFLIRNIAAISC